MRYNEIMETTPQRALFEAITLHNPQAAERAMELGASWLHDQDGKTSEWTYGAVAPGVWRYTGAMMALKKAMGHGRMTILEQIPDGLVDWGKTIAAVLGGTSLAEASEDIRGHEVLEFILDRWPARKLGEWEDSATRHGGTLLHVVAEHGTFGSARTVDTLVDRGMDINARDTRGRTALHVVMNHNAAKALLDRGADPLVLDNRKMTPARTIMERMTQRARKQPNQNTIHGEDVKTLTRLLDASPIEADPKAALLGRHVDSLLARGHEAWKAVGSKSRQDLERHLAVYVSFERRRALGQVAKGRNVQAAGPKLRM